MAIEPADGGHAGIIERVYYAVPTHYTIGEEFPGTAEGHAEACEAARRTIRPILGNDGEPTGWTRAFVDKRYVVRWLPGSGQIGSGADESVKRIELFLSPERQAEVLGETTGNC